MNVVILMLAVTACYTICSLNDKYAAAKANFSGDEFTFLMCSSMSVFLAVSLPFQNLSFSLTWQSFLAISLVTVCKMLEFQMSARVLKQLSAFELKAWLGITLFASYFTDILFGSELNIIKLICIFATAAGLVFIARSSKGGVNYKQIILPLMLYLVSKYGYGLIIRSFSPYASSTMQLLPATKVKQNLILEHTADDELIKGFITAAVSYAESYQHLPENYYSENAMTPTTEQAVIMLSSHFYESRDGSTGGFFGDNVQAGKQVWDTVNMLLRLDRRWKV